MILDDQAAALPEQLDRRLKAAAEVKPAAEAEVQAAAELQVQVQLARAEGAIIGVLHDLAIEARAHALGRKLSREVQQRQGRGRKVQQSDRRGRTPMQDKPEPADRAEIILPEGCPIEVSTPLHERTAWRIEQGRAVHVAYDLYRGPLGERRCLDGVLPRSEFGIDPGSAVRP